MTTSIPAPQFTATGLVIPSSADVLAGAVTDINAAFGNKLTFVEGSAEQQLADTQAFVVTQKNAALANTLAQIDPRTASGVWQDSQNKLYDLSRHPATATTVLVRCSGKTGVTIPLGATIADAAMNLYQAITTGVIPAGGFIDLTFSCTVTGPIQVAPGTVKIYTGISGWDSATNLVAGVPGRYVENRGDFERRRIASVARNGQGQVSSVVGEVGDIPGVIDVYGTDNKTGDPVVIDGVTLLPHSVYICVSGGTDQDIAQALYVNTSDGCQYTGNTSVSVTVAENYVPPYPVYTSKFQRPEDLQFYFSTTVQNLSGQPNSTVEAQIKANILAAFNGGDGGERAHIGALSIAQRYLPAVLSAANPLYVLSLYMGPAPNPVGLTMYAGIGQVPVCSAANILVNFA